MKTKYVLFHCLIISSLLFAETKTSFTSATGLELTHPDAFGIEQSLNYNLRYGLLRHDHPLMKNNSLNMTFETALTPVSLSEKFALSLTPIAFFKFGGSVMVGYGWPLLDSYGTGISDSTGERYVSGIITRTDVFVQLQIETKDIFKNEKLNFQAAIIQRLTHRQFSAADFHQSWIYQDDRGENLNGSTWDQIFFLGYAYPFRNHKNLTVGSLVQMSRNIDHYTDSPMSLGGWGSDFVSATISPLLKMQFSKNGELIFLTSFRRNRVFKESTGTYFMNQQYLGSEIVYEKIQAQFKYSFRRLTN